MGFQDNSGEFFVDAVLTDLGRQKLARNDGSFAVVGYRFADDEIDYRHWNELTGSDNKDKKILDTPIFEALVNETVALRNPLVTIKNSSLQFMPVFTAKPSSVSLRERTDSIGGGVELTVSQESTRSQTIIPPELTDFNYIVSVDNDLIVVANEIPVSIQPFGTAKYIIPARRDRATAANGTQVTCTIRVQSLSTEVFDILVGRSVAKPRTINTTIVVMGQQSGLNVQVPVSILEFATS